MDSIYVCERIFKEGSLACLATNNNEIQTLSRDLYLTFLLMLEQVSVTFRQLPNLPVFVWGGEGVWAKHGHARILANAEIYGRSLTYVLWRTASGAAGITDKSTLASL